MKESNKKYIALISVVLGLLLISIFLYNVFFLSDNNEGEVILNDTFKTLTSWEIYDYEKDYEKNNVSTVSISNEGVNDESSVFIYSDELNDARIYRSISVIPNSYYKISVMTKTFNNGNFGIGANISAINCTEFVNINNTNNLWQELAMYVRTSENEEKINLSLGLGGYSNVSKGYAYFDNLKIEKISSVPKGQNVISFVDVYEKEEIEDVSFVKKYATYIFILAMGFVLVFSVIVCIKKKSEDNTKKYKLNKKDYMLMGILTLIALFLGLYKLGDNFAATSYWKAGQSGENVVIEFDKTTNIRAMAHYGNIPNSGYYDISYLEDELSDEYVTAFTLGEDINEESIDKKPKSSFFNWKFNYGIDFYAKKIKIEAVKPGWGINELAFFTINKDGEYEKVDVKIVSINTSNISDGTPDMLFDEQDLVPKSSTYMNSTYFDEVYFPRTAYEQLNGLKIYELTHPPLGKIIISLGITIFGMNPFGWRIMGALFGAMLVPLMYLFAIKVFKNSKFAFFTAFLMLFDFMRLPQTRLATIDSYSTFFIVCMYYFMYDYFINKEAKKPLKPLFLSGIMFGLGAATKWSCLYAGGGLAFVFFLTKLLEFLEVKKEKVKLKKWVLKDLLPTCLWCVLFFVVIPLTIYVFSYIPYLASNPGENIFNIVIDNQKYIFNYHSKLVETHPYESAWYTWAVTLRPIWLYVNRVLPEGMYSTIASFGNPLVWVISTIGVVLSLFLTFRDKDKRGIILLIGYAFQYFPWILITRITFIYSYFTALPFAIMLLVYCINKLDNGNKITKIILGIYLLGVLVLFVMFFPVLMGSIVSKTYVEWLRWLPTWYF